MSQKTWTHLLERRFIFWDIFRSHPEFSGRQAFWSFTIVRNSNLNRAQFAILSENEMLKIIQEAIPTFIESPVRVVGNILFSSDQSLCRPFLGVCLSCPRCPSETGLRSVLAIELLGAQFQVLQMMPAL